MQGRVVTSGAARCCSRWWRSGRSSPGSSRCSCRRATCRCCRSSCRSRPCWRSACCWCCCRARSTCRPAAASAWRARSPPCWSTGTACPRRSRCWSRPRRGAGVGRDGRVIIVERMPAFIITLGGLLVFRGLHWLVIRNQTVPVVEGGENQCLLAADHVLPAAGGRLRAGRVVVIAHGRRRALRAQARRQQLRPRGRRPRDDVPEAVRRSRSCCCWSCSSPTATAACRCRGDPRRRRARIHMLTMHTPSAATSTRSAATRRPRGLGRAGPRDVSSAPSR